MAVRFSRHQGSFRMCEPFCDMSWGGGGKIIGVWTVSLAIPSRQRSHQQNGFQPHAVDRSCILPRRYRRLWCLFAPISYSEWICWKGFPRKRQMMKRDPRRRRGLVVWTSFFSKKKWLDREGAGGWKEHLRFLLDFYFFFNVELICFSRGLLAGI